MGAVALLVGCAVLVLVCGNGRGSQRLDEVFTGFWTILEGLVSGFADAWLRLDGRLQYTGAFLAVLLLFVAFMK